MNKPRKNEPLVKTAQSTPPTKGTPNVSETDEQREERVNRANQAIREILKKENCILMVPVLDISTGRVFPKIQVVAQQLPK